MNARDLTTLPKLGRLTPIACLMLSGAGGGPFFEHILPEELRTEAARHSCGEIAGFYDRPGMVLPPYVYGVFPGDPEDSAAFWCKPSGNVESRYMLVFFLRSGTIPSRCPSTIEWENYPGGLSLSDEPRVELSEFRSISGKPIGIPAGAKTEYRALSDYYDGSRHLFYCYEGAWVYRAWD